MKHETFSIPQPSTVIAMFWFLTLILLLELAFCEKNEEISSVEVGVDGSQDQGQDQDQLTGEEFETSGEASSPSTRPQVFRQVPGPPPQQYWVKFENISPTDDVELYYDDGRDGVLQGRMKPGESLNIGTYVGHVFFYRIVGSKQRLYQTLMETGVTYLPFKDPKTREEEESQQRREKQEFLSKYHEETGLRWLAYYPRPKPFLYMYPCDNIDDRYNITSIHTYYHCYPATDSLEDINKCRDDPLDSSNWLNLTWRVLSTKPKILEIKNCLSSFEAEHIKDLARPLLERSVTGAGGYENQARTSSNAWVKRSFSDVMDWIFRRIGDITKVDESHLWDTIGSESVQVVHYENGQEYKAHHDWSPKRAQSRFATYLMYLTDMETPDAGGETQFPKIGLKVHPGKGSCAMFYNLLEDGNVDDLTMHAALPVKQGEKWLANVWIWDPNFS